MGALSEEGPWVRTFRNEGPDAQLVRQVGDHRPRPREQALFPLHLTCHFQEKVKHGLKQLEPQLRRLECAPGLPRSYWEDAPRSS